MMFTNQSNEWNQDKLKQLNEVIQGIGIITELWTITFQSFKKLNMSDEEAIMHTKAFISAMMNPFMETNGGGSNE